MKNVFVWYNINKEVYIVVDTKEKNTEFRARLIKIIQEKYNGNSSKFARVADVPGSTVQSYIKREKIATPSIDILEKLALAAGVRLEELYPFRDPEGSLSETLTLGGETYVHTRDKCTYAAIYDMSQAHLNTPESIGGIGISDILYKPGIVVFRVRGNSMSPTISDGALIGMDKGDRQIVSGDVYVVRRTYEGACIRRVFVDGDLIKLVPENRDHQATTLKDVNPASPDFILGKVKWVIQKL